MIGTMREAALAIRVMPPKITNATITAITTPIMNLVENVGAMPETVIIDSVSWLACIKQSVPTIPKMVNAMASGRHFLPKPSVIIYMVPPCVSPAESLPRYIMASEPSKNFVVIPTRALTHIQNTTPGPPIATAIATPAMLPKPTVAAMALINAWNELICPSCLPPSLACFFRNSRIAQGKRRIDTAPE